MSTGDLSQSSAGCTSSASLLQKLTDLRHEGLEERHGEDWEGGGPGLGVAGAERRLLWLLAERLSWDPCLRQLFRRIPRVSYQNQRQKAESKVREDEIEYKEYLGEYLLM